MTMTDEKRTARLRSAAHDALVASGCDPQSIPLLISTVVEHLDVDGGGVYAIDENGRAIGSLFGRMGAIEVVQTLRRRNRAVDAFGWGVGR